MRPRNAERGESGGHAKCDRGKGGEGKGGWDREGGKTEIGDEGRLKHGRRAD